MLLQVLSQGLHQDEPPIAHRLEAEGTPLVDLRHVHDVAHDAIRPRIGARPNRRRVDASHRGEDSMAIEVVHQLLTQPEERRRIAGIKRV